MKYRRSLIATLLIVVYVCGLLGVNASSETELTVAVSENVSGGSAKHFIFEGGDDVRFTVANASGTSNVTDYFGNSYNTSMSKNEISVDTLPYGYYELELDGQSFPFAVVPKLSERRDSSRLPIAFSTQLTHSSRENTVDALSDFVKAVRLAGISYVREQANIHELAGDGGTADNGNISESLLNTWNSSSNYTNIMNAYIENDINVQMLAGSWYQGNSNNAETKRLAGLNKYPTDLSYAYNFFKSLSGKWSGAIRNVEIENEPDLTATRPDKLAAYMKAAALGVESSGQSVDISSGGFSGVNAYMNKFYQNDIKDYIDTLNFHMYDTDETADAEYPSVNTEPQTVYYPDAEKYGLENKQLWLNETGTQVKFEGENTELTDAQKLAQTRYTASSYIENLANGIDKVFFFKHGYRAEEHNGKQYSFGSFSADNHPYPVFSMTSAFTNALGNAKYYGILNTEAAVKAYVFKEGTEEIACIWTTGDDTNVTVDADVSGGALTDIMGNAKPVTFTDGAYTLRVTKDIQYLRISGSFKNCTAGKSYNKVYEKRNIQDEDYIVLNQVFPTAVEEDKSVNTSYTISDNTTVNLQVYNFSDEAKTCSINAKIYNDWDVTPPTAEVSVPAMGKKEISFTLTQKSGTPVAVENALVFDGKVGGKDISRSVSYIRSEAVPQSTLIAYNTGWSANDENIGTASAPAISGDTVSFNRTISNEAGYMFPMLTVDASDFVGADALVYKMKTTGINQEKLTVGLYMNYGDSSSFRSQKRFSQTKSVVITDGEWMDVSFTFDDLNVYGKTVNEHSELDLSQVKTIQLGFVLDGSTETGTAVSLALKDIGINNTPELSTKPEVSSVFAKDGVLSATIDESKHSVNEASVGFYANGEKLKTVASDSGYEATHTPSEGETLTVRYLNDFGKSYEKALTGLTSGKINTYYNTVSSPKHQTTIVAYDVTDIIGADANTPLSLPSTPIKYISAGFSGGVCSFNLEEDYEGRMVVKINNGSDEILNMLVEVGKAPDGTYKFVITELSFENESISVNAVEAQNAAVIFAARDSDGILRDAAAVRSHSFNAGVNTVEFPQDLQISADETLTIFIWNDMIELKPLSGSLSKTRQ